MLGSGISHRALWNIEFIIRFRPYTIIGVGEVKVQKRELKDKRNVTNQSYYEVGKKKKSLKKNTAFGVQLQRKAGIKVYGHLLIFVAATFMVCSKVSTCQAEATVIQHSWQAGRKAGIGMERGQTGTS